MPLGLIEGVLTGKHRLNDFLIVLSIKGWIPAEQDVQDHATAPKVTLVIVVFLEDFGSDVVRCAILLRHFLTWSVRASRPKIDNGDARLVARAIEK